jgi:uncharacterized protein
MELTLFVDHQCNLRCDYCYNGDKFTRPMDMATAQRAIDFVLSKPNGDLRLSFFGGEPLLRKDFVRSAIEYAERAAAGRLPLTFVMNTNATLIDDEALDLMAAPRRFVVFASIDGGADVHDAHRFDAAGRGSFEAARAGLSRLASRAIMFQTVAVVGADTAPRLGDSVRALVSLAPHSILLSPNFRDDWTDASIVGLREGLGQLGDFMISMFRSGTAIAIDPLHTKILTHIHGGIPCPSRCQLAGHEIAVSPSGKLYPCAQMIEDDRNGDLVMGDVLRGLDAAKLELMQKAKDRVETICSPCEVRDRCQSHCGCRHVALSGKLGEITAVLCEIERAFIQQADRIAETLYAERCKAFIDFYYVKQWTASRGAKLVELRRSPGKPAGN